MSNPSSKATAKPRRAKLPTVAELLRDGIVPFFNRELRELRVGDIVVKRFGQGAGIQEPLVEAFQEEGWPRRIYNPLSDDGDRSARERMQDAIRRLNEQIVPLIRFRANGTGEEITWEFSDPGSRRAMRKPRAR